MCYSILLMTACLTGAGPDTTPAASPAKTTTAPAASCCNSCCEEHVGPIKKLMRNLEARLGGCGETCGSCDKCKEKSCCGHCDHCKHIRPCNTCSSGCCDGDYCKNRCRILRRLLDRLGLLFDGRCKNPCCQHHCCECGCSGMGHRLRAFRNGGVCCDCGKAAPAPAQAPEAPKPMPAPPKAPVKMTSTQEIKRQYLPRLGNAADYSWVTGQLFHIHAGGNDIWVVRYAPVDREDRFGGSVVLAPIVIMDSFLEGDLVTVHGDMLNEGRATKYLGGPLYRAGSVNLEDRAR